MNKTTEIFETNSPEDTEKIASELAKKLKPCDFIAFFGDLGSGKTAFVRGLASVLCPECRVSSPTFAIVNEYTKGKIPIFHFDMYRITDDDSLFSTGFYDYFDRNGVIAAEWCENIPYALPENRYEVLFRKTGDSSRIIEITKFDTEG